MDDANKTTGQLVAEIVERERAETRTLAEVEEHSKVTGRRLASEATGFIRNAHQRAERPRRHHDALFWAAVEAVLLDAESWLAWVRGQMAVARDLNAIETTDDVNLAGDSLPPNLINLAGKLTEGSALLTEALRYRTRNW